MAVARVSNLEEATVRNHSNTPCVYRLIGYMGASVQVTRPPIPVFVGLEVEGLHFRLCLARLRLAFGPAKRTGETSVVPMLRGQRKVW